MSAIEARAPGQDINVRDLLSSLTALQGLAMVMTDSREEDEILDLALSAVPSLTRDCRVEAMWLDGGWRLVERLRGHVQPRAGLEDQILHLGSAGGSLALPRVAWAWAFPLGRGGDVSGYLVVGAPEAPPIHERTLIQSLSQQTGVALGNARLLNRERLGHAQIADQHATLRRVATLVARAAPPEDVFLAVAAEAGRLSDADFVSMSRYDSDGSATVVGSWSTGAVSPLPVGTRIEYPQKNVIHSLIFETRRPARVQHDGVSGYHTRRDQVPSVLATEIAGQLGIRCVVGVPIHIEGQLWGAIAGSTRGPLAPDTEEWLSGFTELVASAIANAQARVELRGMADEQAALKRVATLVARESSPEMVFEAVAQEAGRLLDVDFSFLTRYELEVSCLMGSWARGMSSAPFPVGARIELTGQSVHTHILQSGLPARIDDYDAASGPAVELGRELGIRSAVGVPISVEGRLWGALTVAASREEPLPLHTERRLVGFTDLVGTALANAQAHAELTASRVRIVAAADAARHRIERDLHDGAQQRLLSLAMQLRAIQESVPAAARSLQVQLDALADGLIDAGEELQELARGIHPAVLAKGGLPPALGVLARRSAIPVSLDVVLDRRLPEVVELAGYYVVAEALTNAAKHANASAVDVHLSASDDVLHVGVRDDGRGGADLTRGSGLVGLVDRVEALGGSIAIHSPPGAGTSLEITLPLAPEDARPPVVLR